LDSCEKKYRVKDGFLVPIFIPDQRSHRNEFLKSYREVYQRYDILLFDGIENGNVSQLYKISTRDGTYEKTSKKRTKCGNAKLVHLKNLH